MGTAIDQVNNAKGNNAVDHLSTTFDNIDNWLKHTEQSVADKAAELEDKLAAVKVLLVERKAMAAEFLRLYVNELQKKKT